MLINSEISEGFINSSQINSTELTQSYNTVDELLPPQTQVLLLPVVLSAMLFASYYAIAGGGLAASSSSSSITIITRQAATVVSALAAAATCIAFTKVEIQSALKSQFKVTSEIANQVMSLR